MALLNRFIVENFKSIKKLDLELSSFMVFVGPNAAGKTNIVHAIQLLGEILRRGTTEPILEEGWKQVIRRGKRPAGAGLLLAAGMKIPARDLLVRRRSVKRIPDLDGDIQIDIALNIKGGTDNTTISIQSEAVTFSRGENTSLTLVSTEKGLRVSLKGAPDLWELLIAGIDVSKNLQLDLLDTKPSLESRLSLIFSERGLHEDTQRSVLRILNRQRFFLPWIKFLIDACQMARLRLDSSSLRGESDTKERRFQHSPGGSGEGLARAVYTIRGTRDKPDKRFQSVLAQLQNVYPRVEDVIPVPTRPGRIGLIFKERGISEPLDISGVSDGVLHALALLVALESQLPFQGILAIEEPENTIHPWSLKSLIVHAQQRLRFFLLIITTHSPVVVDAVQDPRNLYIVEHGARVGTTVQRATDREGAIVSVMRESGQKLGDIWVDGSLGGVPGGDMGESGEA